MNDIYQRPGSSGNDRWIGRILAGYKMMDPSFASLPPHFTAAKSLEFTDDFWSSLIIGFDLLPTNFRPVLPFLLASLVKHFDWLDKTLLKKHPLRTTRVWTTGVLKTLEEDVCGGVLENKTTGLCATGLTTGLYTMYRLIDLESRSTRALTNKQIQDAQQIAPAWAIQMQKSIEDKINVELAEMRRQLASQAPAIVTNSHSDLAVVADSPMVLEELADVQRKSDDAGATTVYLWKAASEPQARWRHVKQDYTAFETGSVINMFFLWFEGNSTLGYGPYRRFDSKVDFVNCPKTSGANFSKTRTVMEEILKYADETPGVTLYKLLSSNHQKCVQVVELGYSRLALACFPDFNGKQLSVARICDGISEMKTVQKRKRPLETVPQPAA